jgi:uncharacterized protein YbbK (DUF523 family)
MQKNRVLISACLMGDNVRYDGKNKLIHHPILLNWINNDVLVSTCPEVSGGLTIPRPPAEIQAEYTELTRIRPLEIKANANKPAEQLSPSSLRVVTNQSIDVTEQFLLGAQHALDICSKQHIRVAILTDGSPSCGSSVINDGSFQSKKVKGEGVTTALLRKNGIRVFSQNQLEQAFDFYQTLPPLDQEI